MNTYNDYVQYVQQYAVGASNTQLLSELRPHFATLKQKISANHDLLETYNGISNSVASEIDTCASSSMQLSNFTSHFDDVIVNLKVINEGIEYLLQQTHLSNTLKNDVLSFQKECFENLTIYKTQSAIETLTALKNKFLSEEKERKAKQMELLSQVLKWVGIIAVILIVVGIITTYWKVIVAIIVIVIIGGIISAFTKD